MGRIAHLNPRESFVCRECGKRKGGRFFISPTLCKKCAAKRRVRRSNTTVTLRKNSETTKKASSKKKQHQPSSAPTASDGHKPVEESIVVTEAVHRRLDRAARKEVGDDSHVWVAFYSIIGLGALLGAAVGGPVGAVLGFSLGGIVGFFVQEAMSAPIHRAVRERVLELAEARKRRIDEAALFYASAEWRAVRRRVIEEDEPVCKRCGRKVREKRDLAVDHIKPRSKYPKLALSRDNLQVLCRRCNSAKGDREF